MAELNIKHHKRAIFPKGEQKAFLKQTKDILGIGAKKMANLVGASERSLNDWQREKYSISLSSLQKFCKETGMPFPKNIELKEAFWYTSLGSSAGGVAVYKKYGYVGGDPEYRKKKWREWWEIEGRFKQHPIINICKPISLPNKSSKLAEFVGIILGDGGITSKQVTVTLHKIDDKDFINYVRDLFEQLFKIKPAIYGSKKERVVNIVVSRSNLVRYLVEIGLKIGGKVRQQTGVPRWIKESDLFIKSCLRGLLDTDGCFYIDRHKYKEKVYFNCGVNFTNRSLPILNFFKTELEKFGFHPTQKTKYSIFLRREEEVVRYFKEIGSSNPKHLTKFKNYFAYRYGEVPKWS